VKRLLASVSHLALAVLVFLTGVSHADAAGRIQVVASLPDLATVTREVGGDRVEVTALAEPTQDPHFVDARPHLILKLNRADLLVRAGLDLELGWLPGLVHGARNSRIYDGTTGNLDASTAVSVKDLPSGKVDRTMGDVHPSGNPHYMTDPLNAARVARAIADRLARLDPSGSAGYKARSAAFEKKAGEVARRISARFKALPESRRRVVTYHKSLTYLVDWLGLTVVDHLEPKPGIAPSPAHVARVLAEMRRSRVPAIIQEAYYPSRTSQLVAGKSGAKLVLLPGFPDFAAGESYFENLEELTGKLLDALEDRA
jgi:zinc/manganese transport system substrate-binding protein